MRASRSILAVVLLVAACAQAVDPIATMRPSDRPTPLPTASPAVAPSTAPRVGTVPFPLEASIPELQAAMAGGRLTSVELVDTYLARIEAYDDAGPRLNSFISVNPHARDEAAALDAERATSGARGPLHGIPLVVKDNINTTDMPTTAGSLALDGFLPAEDAFQVRRLRDAGAVIIGKTNLCEFANCWLSRSSLGGQTLDPYDISRDPGGSSGGTAVAVAANFAAAGLGTDTCGSVRLPAAHNAIYGLRPTSGLSSRAGVIPFSPTLDEVGPMARSVVDLAILLEATAGVDPADPTTVAGTHDYVAAIKPDGLAGRRIGVLAYAGTGPVGDVLHRALEEFVSNGAEVVEVSLPASPIGDPPYFSEFRPALDSYLAAEPNAPVRSLAEILNQEPFDAAVTPTLQERAAAAAIDEATHERSLRYRTEWRDTLVAFLDEQRLDAIVYPVSTRVAARIGGEQEHFDCWTSAASGLPALALPAGFTPDGLPVGLELLGRPFAESTLIALAAGFEAHTDHRILPPSTPPLAPAP